MPLNPFDQAVADLPPAPTSNPFEAFTPGARSDQEQQTATRLRTQQRLAVDQNPDARARALNAARELGIPAQWVDAQNLAEVERDAADARTPYDRIAAESPHLAAWLAGSDDHAAISQGDVHRLGLVDWLLTMPGKARQRGWDQIELGRLRTQELLGHTLTPGEADRATALKAALQAGGDLDVGNGWFRSAVAGFEELLPNILTGTWEGVKGGGIGAGIGAGLGALGAGVTLQPELLLPLAGAGARLGGRVGFVAGSAKFGFELEAGLAYDEYRDVKDEQGRTLDPDAARAAAIAVGVINAGIEALQIEKLVGPVAEKLGARGVRQAVKEALKVPTTRAALAAAMKEWGKVNTFEALTEAGQRFVTILGGEAAKTKTGVTPATVGEVATDVTREFTGAFASFALASGVPAGLHGRAALTAAKTATASQQFFTALGDATAKSETIQRAPAAVASFIERATEDGPIAAVYVDAQRWREYWQGQGVDPVEVTAEVTGSPDALETALRTGEDLEISMGTYATRLAPTAHNAGLAPFLRLGADAMTSEEQEQLIEAQKALGEAETAAAASAQGAGAPEGGSPPSGAPGAAGEAAQAPTLESLQALTTDLTRQLVTRAGYAPRAAQATAELFERAIGRMAVDAGFDPYAVYEGYGLRVQRSATTGPLDAPARALGTQPAIAETAGAAALPLTGEGSSAEDEAHNAVRPRAAEGPAGAGSDTRLRLAPSRPSAAENDVTRTVRRTAGETDRALEARRDTARRDAATVRRVAHTDALFAHVAAFARDLDPALNLDALRAEFDLRLAIYDETVALYRESGRDPRDLLRAIAAVGGISTRRDKAFSGEVAQLAEGQTFGRVRGVKGVFAKEGQPLDDIATSLRQDDRFQWITSPQDLLEAVDEALRFETKYEEGVLPGSDTLREDLGIDTTRAWWANGWSVANAALTDDAVDTGGDVSFDISEFQQNLRDLFEQTDADANQPAAADTLDTGEVQPRLPGAEGVRDQEVATPTLDAPFSLTSEVAPRPKGTQRELFQSAYHGTPHEFDRFTLEAIGTGEGHQAYGWGLYFASLKEVADQYRKNLTGRQSQVVLKGRVLTVPGDRAWTSTTDGWLEAFARNILSDIENATMGADFEAAKEQAIADAEFRVLQERTRGSADVDNVQAALDELRTLQEGDLTRRLAGRTYTVDIPEDDDFLSWDLRASEQSPKVQAALRALGVTWEPFVMPTPTEARALFETDRVRGLMDASVNEGWGTIGSDVLHEGWELLSHGAIKAFEDWFRDYGVALVGRDAWKGDPQGSQIYRDLVSGKIRAGHGGPDAVVFGIVPHGVAERRASEALRDAGLAGIRYLDGQSRQAGQGTQNYVVVDDRLVTVREFDQPTGRPPLVVHHNLTERNLLHAEARGGLAVPSLAITTADQALTKFGEITLIGDAAMADPAQGAQVFGADIYSARYPTIHWKVGRAGEKVLGALVKATSDVTGQNWYDLDQLQTEGAKYLKDVPGVAAQFLRDKGVALPEGLRELKDGWGRRRALEATIEARGLEDAFDAYTEHLFDSLQPTEQIYRGFTNSGRRSYKPHTMANVVAILKKELRGGEATHNIYGVGQLRAHFTPKFRSLAAVRKAAGRLVSDEAFEAVKQEVETELFTITENLKPYYKHGDAERFGFVDTVLAVMEEAPRGLTTALRNYGFEGVPADVHTAIGDYLQKLRTLPTEYFEVKHLRAVGIHEFAAAVVPDTASDAVKNLLYSHGLQVVEYPARDQAARQAAIASVASDLSLLFQEKKPGDRRGSIQFKPDGTVNINLFERADLSTFLHEGGHFFLQVLHDLAGQVSAIEEAARTPGQVRLLANYEAALAALDATSWAEVEHNVEKQEKFAQQFEAYLHTGEAPSLALRELFGILRNWFRALYDSVRRLGGPVSPELRAVFDRMLATDAELAAIEPTLTPLFTTAEQAGMSPERFALYEATLRRAHDDAQAKADAALQSEVRQQRSAAWTARRDELRAAVTTEVHDQPVYRALAAIRRGTNPDGTPILGALVTEPLRISRTIVAARYGTDRLATLPPFTSVTEGGVDPDGLAETLGFTSGDALLTAISEAPAMRQAIEDETTRRMLQEQPSLLLSGELHEVVQAAVANETREAVLRAELKALAAMKRTVRPFVAQAVGDVRAEAAATAQTLRAERAERRSAAVRIRHAVPSAATLMEAAHARLDVTAVGALRPERHWMAMQKASRLATETAARGDVDSAIRHKTQELTALALYREAVTRKQDIARRLTRMTDLTRPATQARIGKLGGHWLAQINGWLSRYGLAAPAAKTMSSRPDFANWLAGIAGEGIPVEELPASFKVPHADQVTARARDITTAQFFDLTDGITMLATWAGEGQRASVIADAAAFRVKRDALIAAAEAHITPRALPLAFDAAAARQYTVANAYAVHLKLGAIARMLDGGTDGGAWWEAIVRPFNRADDTARTRKQQAFEAYTKLFELLPGGLATMQDKQEIAGIRQALTREQRLAVALNWGTETNRQRLLSDPVRKWTEADVSRILDTLTEAEWDFVRGTWAYLDTFWAETVALQERVTGVPPTKVDAKPFLTKFGEMPGGYYPIAYDPRLNARASQHEDARAAKALYEGSYVRATTNQGHTRERVSNVRSSVKLELGVGFTHVENVIHDLTHREAFLQVNQLLRDTKVGETLYKTVGQPVYRQMVKSIDAIAQGTSGDHTGERAFTWMRQGTQIATLGFKAWTAVQQPLGLFNGMQRVGVAPVTKALVTWLRSPRTMTSTVRWIAEVSPFMRDRAATANQDLLQLRQDFEQAGGWFDVTLRKATGDRLTQQVLTNGFLWHIAAAQRVADVPTWLGAYEKHLADPRAEGVSDEAHESRAVHLADQAVIDSQGSGSIKDLSGVQRGGPALKAWMAFYSYGATTFNAAATAYQVTDFKDPQQVAKFIADLSLIYVMPAVGTIALANLLGRRDDDDPAEMLKAIAGESLGSALNGLVLVRELSRSFLSHVAHLEDEGGRYQGPAGTRLLTDIDRLFTQVGQWKLDPALWDAVLDVSGVLLRWPSSQLETTLDAWMALEEGRTRNPFTLLTGAPKKEDK